MIVNRFPFPTAAEVVDISAATVTSAKSLTYNGANQTQTFTVTLGGNILVQGTDYTISGNVKKSAGSYTATITGIGKYTGTKSVSWSIAKFKFTKVTVSATPTTINTSTDTIVSVTVNLTPAAPVKVYCGYTVSTPQYVTCSVDTTTPSKSAPKATFFVKAKTASAPSYVIMFGPGTENYDYTRVMTGFTCSS